MSADERADAEYWLAMKEGRTPPCTPPASVVAEKPITEVNGTTSDPVNAPAHYTQHAIEPIDVIESWGLDFCRGCVLKYLARAPFKGHELQDLRKAAWYLNRAIRQMEETSKCK